MEYELRDRDLAQTRKLDPLIRRRSLRVEWYIVILIAVEIAIIVWEIYRG